MTEICLVSPALKEPDVGLTNDPKVFGSRFPLHFFVSSVGDTKGLSMPARQGYLGRRDGEPVGRNRGSIGWWYKGRRRQCCRQVSIGRCRDDRARGWGRQHRLYGVSQKGRQHDEEDDRGDKTGDGGDNHALIGTALGRRPLRYPLRVSAAPVSIPGASRDRQKQPRMNLDTARPSGDGSIVGVGPACGGLGLNRRSRQHALRQRNRQLRHAPHAASIGK